MKRATGVDLVFDVDKLVISSTLVVARGRFDQKKLTEKLSAHRFIQLAIGRGGKDNVTVIIVFVE